MREYEHLAVIHRLLAPPALPVLVGPGTAHRAEHVAAHDPRAEIFHAFRRHGIVDAGFAVVLAGDHGAKDPRGKKPSHDFGEVDPERILETLVGTGAVA